MSVQAGGVGERRGCSCERLRRKRAGRPLRWVFLAADGVDVQFACTDIFRRMSNHDESDLKLLKTLARYLRTNPRIILQFKRQDLPTPMTTVVYRDFAGCRRTWRSIEGGCRQFGRHIAKSWLTTQKAVAMSSGTSAQSKDIARDSELQA